MRRRHTLLLLPVLALAACSRDTDPEPVATQPPDTTTATTTVSPAAPDLSTWTPEPAPSGEQGTPRGLDLDPETVDTGDPVQVAEAFAKTMLTPDTLLDRSPADVSRRAARWADDQYGAQLREDRPAGGGADWVALGQDQGYLSVQLHTHPAIEAGLVDPGDEDLAVEVPLLATLTAHDAHLATREIAALVSLHRTHPDAPWRVYAWHQEDFR